MKIHSTISLKLFAYGIQKLHDPNWTGIELYDKLKEHVRGRVEPVDMLYKTIQDGLLFHLGKWLYAEYLQHENCCEILDDYEYGEDFDFAISFNCDGEYALWYLEDYIEFLISIGINKNEKLIKTVISKVDEFNDLYLKDEEQYIESLHIQNKLLQTYILQLACKYKLEITSVADIYSQDFAERVFHDRLLCEYISNLIMAIGFDGDDEDSGFSQKWIDREYMPEWAKKAVITRDRGKCSECGVDITMELEEEGNIDHIIPLKQGGTNDVSNLQLLCRNCNSKKLANIIPTKTSIPKYLQIKRKK